ncbi:MAG TPA: glycosyltransferase family 2 protein [Chloroflexota bacterium]
MSARVSALIVSFNTCQLTLEAVGSVVSQPDVQTIVVDNASRDGSPARIAAEFPSVRLLRSETNLGFAGGVNRAATCADGATLLVLNSDARLEPGALERLCDLLDRVPPAGLVAPALYYPDGRPQPAAFAFPGLVQIGLDLYPVDRLMDSRLNGRVHATRPTRVDHPLGACMLIRRAAWDDVGPLDEGYFMYLEEVDWCRRAHARGWEVWHHPGARAIHHGGSSTHQHADAMFRQLWLARLRYYQRFSGPTYNRLVHALVRAGLRRDRRAGPVRHLTA